MEEPFESPGIRGILHRPESENGHVLLLTHGAGANCKTPLLIRLARAFESAGYLVLRYDLPFRQQRPKGPPFPAGAARDREGIARCVEAARQVSRGRVFLGGHSYGGRQSAMLAAERPELASALLLLSYPLHPPDQPENKRIAFFPQLRTPVLFVHGTRDPFASPEELRDAMALIPAATDLLPVEGASHDLARAADLSVEMITRLERLLSHA
ncbi:MAG: alpha/beta hydrolase [Terriglobia bacterium]|nr:MAG: alpha/beta hydrolase [Terriglobia bacterium]